MIRAASLSENGFTLIEMLVSLAIGSVLLAIIANMISGFSTELRAAAPRSAAAAQPQRIVQLRNLLREARFVDSEGKLLPHLNNSVQFVRRKSDVTGRENWQSSQLIISTDADGRTLKLWDRGEQSGKVILSNLRSAYFRFPLVQTADIPGDDGGSAADAASERAAAAPESAPLLPIELFIETKSGNKMEMNINVSRMSNFCCGNDARSDSQ